MSMYSIFNFGMFNWSSDMFANSQKVTESLLEYNGAVMRSSEILSRRMFDNYVTNMTEGFEEMKTLNRARDVDTFIRRAARQSASTVERVTEQSRYIADLSNRLMMETGEVGILAYNKSIIAHS